MHKTITAYKDHTDDILSKYTGDKKSIEEFKAAALVRFKQYPNIRFELKNAWFEESKAKLLRLFHK